MGFLCDIAVIGEGATLAHYLRALLPGDAQVHEAETLDALPRVRVAWVSARALARQGQLLWSLRRFRAGGGLVAFEASGANDPDWLARGFAAADIAFASHGALQALSGPADPETCAARIAAFGPLEVVLRCGTAPAILMVDGRPARIPLPQRVTPLDRAGVREAFTAAWLATRLSGACATTATIQAHRLAAHVLQRPGARVALPGSGEPAPVGQHLVGVV